MTAALESIRILDLSRLLPGPYLTQLLADLGAEVIKVEGPDSGDYLRHMPPLAGQVGAAFAALNRGKRSVCLDLKKPADIEKFLGLLVTADVLLESFRPGVMERLGLGPDTLLAHHPRLVFCRISGYGQTGPDALRAGHDLNYVARSGLLGLMPEPTVLPVQVADLVGGALLPAVQILAALRLRDSSGQGAVIDAAMIDGAWATMVMPLARHLGGGISLDPGRGVLCGGVPSYNIYRSKDGALAVGALEPKFWQPFCRAIGLEHQENNGLAQGDQGKRVQQEVQAVLETRTNEQWLEILGPLDCCVEPVRHPATAHIEDPALSRRTLVDEVDLGQHKALLPLSTLQVGQDTRVRTGPSELGADNQKILKK